MKLTVTNFTGDIYNLDVAGDMEVENLCALCEFETNIPASQIVLIWNGKVLKDKRKSISSYGIKENDVLLIQPTSFNQQNQQSAGAPGIMCVYIFISLHSKSNST